MSSWFKAILGIEIAWFIRYCGDALMEIHWNSIYHYICHLSYIYILGPHLLYIYSFWGHLSYIYCVSAAPFFIVPFPNAKLLWMITVTVFITVLSVEENDTFPIINLQTHPVWCSWIDPVITMLLPTSWAWNKRVLYYIVLYCIDSSTGGQKAGSVCASFPAKVFG